MKIRAHVLSVQLDGDQLHVRASGYESGQSEDGFYPCAVVEFKVRDIGTHRASLYVGRELAITIDARGRR